MPFRSVAARKVVLWTVGVMLVAAAVRAQSPKTVAKPAAPPGVRLRDESAGVDAIARALFLHSIKPTLWR